MGPLLGVDISRDVSRGEKQRRLPLPPRQHPNCGGQLGAAAVFEGGGTLEETIVACLNLGRRCAFEEEHSRQDARLAVQLFDLLADLHELGDRDRELLYLAGLLHDIGYVDGYWGHHKTAYRLIMAADLPGLTERERLVVANVTRYHRGARPKVKHKGFAALEPDDRRRVTVLGAILRLADGLDRGHMSAVQGLDARLEGQRLVILVDCPAGCSSEVWAGEKKGRFLGDVLGLRLKVRRSLPGSGYP